RAQSGDAEGSRRDADEAIGCAETSADPIALGFAAEIRARRLAAQGDLDGANDQRVRSSEAFQRAGNDQELARSMIWRAILARQRFRFDEAEDLLARARTLASELLNRVALGEVMRTLSSVRVE